MKKPGSAVIPMKIVYLSNSYFPSRYANSVQVMNMCAGFASLGHSVTLFGLEGSSEGNSAPNSLHEQYGLRATFQFRLFPRILPFSFPLDGSLSALRMVLHIYLEKADLVYGRNIIAMWLASFLNVPLILEVHDLPKGRLKKFVLSRLRQCESLLKVIAISESLREEYRAYLGRGTEILVAPSGSLLGVPEKSPSEPGKSTELFTVGYAGAFFPGRGVETIIGIATYLPTIRFRLCGGTIDELKAIVGESEIPPNLDVYGRLEPRNVSAFLSQCGALLAPYQENVGLSERGNTVKIMSPLKIFEYMKSKRPIVASNLPVLREVLTHNTNALLCEPTDLAGWIEAVSLLESNRKIGRRLASAAFKDFKTAYSSERRAKAILDGLD